AGPKLLKARQKIGDIMPGDAALTAAYALNAKYVIHTVGPVWQGGAFGEKELLASCYTNALTLAKEKGCTSIAFPLISSGVFGYPKAQAMRVAMEAIGAFLLGSGEEEDMTVYLVVFGKEDLRAGEKFFADIEEFIDDHYVEAHVDRRREARRGQVLRSIICGQAAREIEQKAAAPKKTEIPCLDALNSRPYAPPGAFDGLTPGMGTTPSLDEMLNCLDESFSEMMMRKIAEKGMKNAECYKKANIDKKLFSKIRNDIHYKPKKTTALAFAVALELNLDETKELLAKAGLALSHSEKFDVIVEYFILKKQYNIFEINETLFAYDQALLGGVSA
ncbi:MAG: macro domain-containing protein, partial [Oscillospiraceae bacterium]|nr:macro domain-containing protein [Oscillospiraceae bacterium]